MIDRTKAPAIHEFGELILPSTSTEILPDGTPVHWLDYGQSAFTRISVIVEGGEDSAKPEMMRLMAQMMLEAPAGMRPEEMSELMDFNGAWTAPMITNQFAGAQMYALNSRLEYVLGPLLGCVFNAAMPEERFAQLRDTSAARIAVDMKRPAEMASRVNDPRLYGPHHPQARYATPESVAGFTYDEIVDLYRRWHTGRRHIYICGRLTDEVKKQYVEALSALSAPHAGLSMNIEPYKPESPGTTTFDMPHSLQTAIEMSIPVPFTRGHHDYIPLFVTVAALGGYFGSRLMTEVRERLGLTYGISAGLYGALDGTNIKIQMQCDNSYADRAQEAVIAEIERMVQCPPQGEELTRIKRYLTTVLASKLDTPFTAMDYHIFTLTLGTPADYFARQRQVIDSITPEQMAELTQKYIRPAELRTALAGALHNA